MISLLVYDDLGEAVEIPCLVPPDADPPGLDDVLMFHPSLSRASLALPPDPTRPPPRLGQIVWPCWGATRYAVGHVLVSDDGLRAMKDVNSLPWDSFRYVDVQFTDDRDDPFTVPMFVVGMRPLNDPREEAAVDVDAGVGQAWVLTLSDYRWLYADKRGGLGNSTWGNLIIGGAAWLGVSPSAATVDAMLAGSSPAYPAPGGNTHGGSVYNAPVLTQSDAAAAAVNLRIVPRGDYPNTVAVQDAATAQSAWEAWWAEWGPKSISGGLIDASVPAPETVTFVFQLDSSWTQVLSGTTPGIISLDKSTSISDNDAYISIDVPHLYASSDRTNYRDRFTADMLLWWAAGAAQATIAGLVPQPVSGVPYSVVWTSRRDDVSTRIDRGPLNYPWPLVCPRWKFIPFAATDQITGSSTLAAGSNLVATITLQPGNYLLSASAGAQIAPTGGTPGTTASFVDGRIFNSTTGLYLTGSFHVVGAYTGEVRSGSGSMTFPFACTVATTLQLELYRSDWIAPTGVTCTTQVYGSSIFAGPMITAVEIN